LKALFTLGEEDDEEYPESDSTLDANDADISSDEEEELDELEELEAIMGSHPVC